MMYLVVSRNIRIYHDACGIMQYQSVSRNITQYHVPVSELVSARTCVGDLLDTA